MSCVRSQLRCAALGHCCDELRAVSDALRRVGPPLRCAALGHCCDELCAVSAVLCRVGSLL